MNFVHQPMPLDQRLFDLSGDPNRDQSIDTDLFVWLNAARDEFPPRRIGQRWDSARCSDHTDLIVFKLPNGVKNFRLPGCS